MDETPRPRHILPLIVFSQFAGGSTWFAGNAVLPELMRLFDLPASALSHLTSAVQLGFITGTLCSAFFNVPDRVSPRVIFLVSSLLNAVVNGAVCVLPVDMSSLTVLRFLTGVFLAGIYPIGMQIAASWYREGLGRALGYLVGSLVLGTAFPHLVRGFDTTLPWMTALIVVSVLSATGGLVTFALVPMGPHARRAARFDPKAIGLIFHSRELRAAAFGYFGHMWELYTMWAFVPVFLGTYAAVSLSRGLDVSLWSFGIIAVGSLGCVLGGFVSIRRGARSSRSFSSRCRVPRAWRPRVVLTAAGAVPRGHAPLGNRRRGRLTAVLRVDGSRRAASPGRVGAHDRHEHRVRDHDRIHPGRGTLGDGRSPPLPVGVSRGGSDRGHVGSTAVARARSHDVPVLVEGEGPDA